MRAERNSLPSIPQGLLKFSDPMNSKDSEKRIPALHNTHGFTLIGILVAMVVSSIGLLGLAQTSLVVINTNVASLELTTGTTLAREKIEAIHRAGYDAADAAAGTESYGSIPNYLAYKRVTSVAPNTPAAEMKTVTVTVSWNSEARFVTLRTLLAP